jgi:hypothetical protein
VAVVRRQGIGGAKWIARLEPVTLRYSKRTRLSRLYPAATWREDTGQLLVPVASPQVAPAELLALLEDLVDPSIDSDGSGEATGEVAGEVAGVSEGG